MATKIERAAVRYADAHIAYFDKQGDDEAEHAQCNAAEAAYRALRNTPDADEPDKVAAVVDAAKEWKAGVDSRGEKFKLLYASARQLYDAITAMLAPPPPPPALERCWSCGGEGRAMIACKDGDPWRVSCVSGCGAAVRYFPTRAKAEAAWNATARAMKEAKR